MTDPNQDPSRRRFIQQSLTGSALLASGSLGGAAAAQETSPPPNSSHPASADDSKLSREYHAPDWGPTFEKLYRHIQPIEAFNHHLHFGDEAGTLDWFHPKATVGKSESASRGIVPGLLQLLGMPGDRITPENADQVTRRYKAFVEKHSQSDFYHKLGDLTHTRQILFMAFPYERNQIVSLPSDRLKLAMYIDHFLFPLDNSEHKSQHPSYANRLGGLEQSMRAEIEANGPVPKDFAGYLAFVDRAIAGHRHTPGVIGAKMSFSYYRSFDVRPVSQEDAKQIYEARDASPESYRQLQDFMAFYVLKTCGDHELPVQIHTGLGSDPGLILQNTNPALLDRLLSRPELTATRIVLIHGAYPYCTQLGVMAKRENVWLDFSWMPLFLHPTTLARYLQEWLEFCGPNKILFGVDAAGLAMVAGTWCARRALSLALARMVDQGQITEVDAVGWAHAVMGKNARGVYEKTLD